MFAEAAYMNTHRDIGEAYSAGCSLLWMLCVCAFRSAASAHEWLHWLQVASSAGKENRRLLDWDQLMLLQLKVNPLSGDLAKSFQSSKSKLSYWKNKVRWCIYIRYCPSSVHVKLSKFISITIHPVSVHVKFNKDTLVFQHLSTCCLSCKCCALCHMLCVLNKCCAVHDIRNFLSHAGLNGHITDVTI